MTEQFDTQKARASAWFRQLRDDIVASFERLEADHRVGPMSEAAAGKFAARAGEPDAARLEAS